MISGENKLVMTNAAFRTVSASGKRTTSSLSTICVVTVGASLSVLA